jgi:hypothetical protein
MCWLLSQLEIKDKEIKALNVRASKAQDETKALTARAKQLEGDLSLRVAENAALRTKLDSKTVEVSTTCTLRHELPSAD